MINDVSTVPGSAIPVIQTTCVFSYIRMYEPIAHCSLLKE